MKLGSLLGKALNVTQSAGTTIYTTNPTTVLISPGSWNINTNSDLSMYNDEEIMNEYLKRFSPLAKAMEESNE